MNPKQAKKLGAYLRQHRQAQGLSVRAMEALSGITFGTIARLEQGAYAVPAADKLARMAEALHLPVADIYALAGYAATTDLPSPGPYFRAKFRSLPQGQLEAVSREVEALLKRHGINPSGGPLPGEDEAGKPQTRSKSKTKGGQK